MDSRTFVSLLRAVNVGGRTVRSEKLKSLYTSLGYSDVRVFLQSGNVVFSAKVSAKDIPLMSIELEKNLKGSFGFEIAVILKTREQISNIIRGNPFSPGDEDESYLHVTFLKSEPRSSFSVAELDGARTGAENYAISGEVVYVYCPNGYGRTKLNNNFFERKLGVLATTRNWRTVNSLLEV